MQRVGGRCLRRCAVTDAIQAGELQHAWARKIHERWPDPLPAFLARQNDLEAGETAAEDLRLRCLPPQSPDPRQIATRGTLQTESAAAPFQCVAVSAGAGALMPTVRSDSGDSLMSTPSISSGDAPPCIEPPPPLTAPQKPWVNSAAASRSVCTPLPSSFQCSGISSTASDAMPPSLPARRQGEARRGLDFGSSSEPSSQEMNQKGALEARASEVSRGGALTRQTRRTRLLPSRPGCAQQLREMSVLSGASSSLSPCSTDAPSKGSSRACVLGCPRKRGRLMCSSNTTSPSPPPTSKEPSAAASCHHVGAKKKHKSAATGPQARTQARRLEQGSQAHLSTTQPTEAAVTAPIAARQPRNPRPPNSPARGLARTLKKTRGLGQLAKEWDVAQGLAVQKCAPRGYVEEARRVVKVAVRLHGTPFSDASV
jgi:hypothetical protein